MAEEMVNELVNYCLFCHVGFWLLFVYALIQVPYSMDGAFSAHRGAAIAINAI